MEEWAAAIGVTTANERPIMPERDLVETPTNNDGEPLF